MGTKFQTLFGSLILVIAEKLRKNASFKQKYEHS